MADKHKRREWNARATGRSAILMLRFLLFGVLGFNGWLFPVADNQYVPRFRSVSCRVPIPAYTVPCVGNESNEQLMTHYR